MTGDDNSGGNVTYRVKDLLAEINSKLDAFIGQLATKAERSDMHELKGRVATLEKQVEVMNLLSNQREVDHEKGLSNFQQYVVIFSSLASTVALGTTLIHYFS